MLGTYISSWHTIIDFVIFVCQKILTTMIPTTEEIEMIVQASQENPDKELGSAEALLSIMSSIPELQARLNLWAFKLDYDQREKVC